MANGVVEEPFSQMQKVVAKHVYILLKNMTPAERRGAALLIATQGVMTEDGFIAISGNEDSDFYVQCYEVIQGSIIALTLAEELKLLPGKVKAKHTPPEELKEDIEEITRVLARLTNKFRLIRHDMANRDTDDDS